MDDRHSPEILKECELNGLEEDQRRPIIMPSTDPEEVFAAYDEQVKVAAARADRIRGEDRGWR